MWRSLRDRGVTHVLLTWLDKQHLSGRNAWMDGLLAGLQPHMSTAFDSTTADGAARAVLLAR